MVQFFAWVNQAKTVCTVIKYTTYTTLNHLTFEVLLRSMSRFETAAMCSWFGPVSWWLEPQLQGTESVVSSQGSWINSVVPPWVDCHILKALRFSLSGKLCTIPVVSGHCLVVVSTSIGETLFARWDIRGVSLIKPSMTIYDLGSQAASVWRKCKCESTST